MLDILVCRLLHVHYFIENRGLFLDTARHSREETQLNCRGYCVASGFGKKGGTLSNTPLSQWPFKSSVHCKWFTDQGTSTYRKLTALQICFTNLPDLQSKKLIQLLFGPSYRSEKSLRPAPPNFWKVS